MEDTEENKETEETINYPPPLHKIFHRGDDGDISLVCSMELFRGALNSGLLGLLSLLGGFNIIILILIRKKLLFSYGGDLEDQGDGGDHYLPPSLTKYA